MGYKIPNGGTFQHAATYATALAFASITNATEAVATVVGGTLSAGDIVLLTSGWSKLDSKVVRVKAATATAITLEGIDTTDTQIFPAEGAAGLLAILGPLALATAAVGGLAYAFYKGSEEQDSYNKSLILTGNYAGVSAGQLGDMARQVSATVGTTGQAAEVLALLAGNGKIAGESFTSYFTGGGGGNGLAAGSAGATSSNLGASSAGYSSSYFPQALGGAWSSGVQMFANGGAFTNSIVSAPTAFGMAGGRAGVMGEAGPEAIMPLTRTSSGKLGVIAAGGGSGTAISINAPVTVVTEDRSSEGMQIDQQALSRNLQSQMQAVAERAVADSWRAGGTSFRNANGRA